MKRRMGVIALIAALCLLLSACSKPDTASLSEVFTQMKSAVALSEMVEFSSVSDLDRFYGIAAENVADFAGGINSSGVQQEEIVLIKATGADAAQRVYNALTNRLNAKLSENKDYNPEQYAMIEKCSVDINDDYVSMIISGNAEDLKAIYREAIGI